MSVATVFAIIGGFALLVGLLGGIEVKEIHIPRQSAALRIVLAIIGMGFLGLAIFLTIPDAVLSTPTPMPAPPIVMTEELIPTTTPEPRQEEVEPTPTKIIHCVLSNTKARVAYTDGRTLTVRKSIGTSSSIMTVLPEGTEFTLMAGPVLDGDYWWWQIVMTDGSIGWVAEGEADVCYIEPLP